jgi:hypothetical protein
MFRFKIHTHTHTCIHVKEKMRVGSPTESKTKTSTDIYLTKVSTNPKKLDADGVADPGLSGAGGLLRDDWGRFLEGFAAGVGFASRVLGCQNWSRNGVEFSLMKKQDEAFTFLS